MPTKMSNIYLFDYPAVDAVFGRVVESFLCLLDFGGFCSKEFHCNAKCF